MKENTQYNSKVDKLEQGINNIFEKINELSDKIVNQENKRNKQKKDKIRNINNKKLEEVEKLVKESQKQLELLDNKLENDKIKISSEIALLNTIKKLSINDITDINDINNESKPINNYESYYIN